MAAHSEIPVLLTGEMGTGKEWFAKTIHLNSDRCEKNFVIVDCSAMNPPIQQALVTAIEQQVFVPVGGLHTETSDFRVVASNSGNSDRGPGCFQKDFFSGLKGGCIHLPSLEQRQEDIIAIAIYYMDRYCKKYKIASKGNSPECPALISSYARPGNVMELINAMGKAIASAKKEPTLYSVHLPSFACQLKEQIVKYNRYFCLHLFEQRKHERHHLGVGCLGTPQGKYMPPLSDIGFYHNFGLEAIGQNLPGMLGFPSILYQGLVI